MRDRLTEKKRKRKEGRNGFPIAGKKIYTAVFRV